MKENIMERRITPRGFTHLRFVDLNESECWVQESSRCLDGHEDDPGSSALWVGVQDARPLILASKAAEHGVDTRETCGWVPYPVPDDVLLTTRMHLTREQARDLADVLRQWAATGHL